MINQRVDYTSMHTPTNYTMVSRLVVGQCGSLWRIVQACISQYDPTNYHMVLTRGVVAGGRPRVALCGE